MNLNNKNVAYDLSLFEEVKRKNNIVKLPRKTPRAKAKINVVHALALGSLCIASVGIIGTFVYNQVQLNELTSKIFISQKALNESQSLYTQLLVKSESKMSLSVIEDYAINNLNMIKLEPSQVEYVNLPVKSSLN